MRRIYVPVLASLALVVPATSRATDQTMRPNACRPEIAMASPAASIPSRASADWLTERDVREWLVCYKSAWDARDVQALTALGVIRDEQQPALRRVLAGYKRLDVAVSNEHIKLDGGRAVLSFERTDTDETREALQHPRPTGP